MAKLICTAQTSLDGYIADEKGDFGWAEPDAEVHAFINDMERPAGTYLYGRRLYETMVFWATAPTEGDESPVAMDYAKIWQAADKIVYSTTLEAPRSPRTRIERTFDPAAVRALKAKSTRDLTIGGPGLAAHAFQAGLVDEVRVLIYPQIVGSGTRLLPDGFRSSLRLLEGRRFGSDVIFLRYAVSR